MNTEINTQNFSPIPRKRKAFGKNLSVFWYNVRNVAGPTNVRIALKNSTMQNTLPISSIGTILVIIERMTVVEVESRKPIPHAR